MSGRVHYVYILTNYLRTVLYVGRTNNIHRRIIQHYNNRGNKDPFTGRYNVYFLLRIESYTYVNDAIAREKEIKKWRREKKVALITKDNPDQTFLNEELFGTWPPEKTEWFKLYSSDSSKIK
jgi:putative endonuclease